MENLNYFERKKRGEVQRGQICSCDENHWCNNCDPKRFPKPSGGSMIFTGNTVNYKLAEKLSIFSIKIIWKMKS